MDNEEVVCIGGFILNIAGFEIPGDICYIPNDAEVGATNIRIRLSQTDSMVTAAMKYMGITSQSDIQARLTTLRDEETGGPGVAILLVDTRAE